MILRNMFVCEDTDILEFAQKEKMGEWNALHDLIWRGDRNDHRHWFLDSFVITSNFFNPEYYDDAYGLLWNEKVRDVVQAFMKSHRVKKMLVVTGKNHSLLVL